MKLAGKVTPDPETGQLITTIDDAPQLPVSDFRFAFREGARAPLITPPRCGTYTTKATFTPWANPASPFTATSSFEVTSGPNGEPCPAGPLPFRPGFTAGAQNNNAGSYSPFYMRLTRRDGDQDLTRFSAKLPPGMIAKLAGTSQCSEAAIAAAEGKERQSRARRTELPGKLQDRHHPLGRRSRLPAHLRPRHPLHGGPLRRSAARAW